MAISISLSIRHGDAPKDLQAFAGQCAARLEKFLRDSARLELHLSKEREEWSGEAILHGSRQGERNVAKESAGDARTCVDTLVEKLERQLEKEKEKRKDHRGPSFAGEGVAPGAPKAPEEPSYEQIVRRELKDKK